MSNVQKQVHTLIVVDSSTEILYALRQKLKEVKRQKHLHTRERGVFSNYIQPGPRVPRLLEYGVDFGGWEWFLKGGERRLEGASLWWLWEFLIVSTGHEPSKLQKNSFHSIIPLPISQTLQLCRINLSIIRVHTW